MRKKKGMVADTQCCQALLIETSRSQAEKQGERAPEQFRLSRVLLCYSLTHCAILCVYVCEVFKASPSQQIVQSRLALCLSSISFPVAVSSCTLPLPAGFFSPSPKYNFSTHNMPFRSSHSASPSPQTLPSLQRLDPSTLLPVLFPLQPGYTPVCHLFIASLLYSCIDVSLSTIYV